MKLWYGIPVLMVAALAMGSLAPAQTPQGGKGNKAELDKLKQTVHNSGRLPRSTYWHSAEVLRGGKRQIIAASVLVKSTGKSAALTSGDSKLTTIGGQGLPEGFGSGFTWDRADNEVLLVMFVNAADALGISVDGLKAGDQVQVISASGVASYSQSKGNPIASSLVGLAAAGAKVAVPEISPVITAAEKFAKEQFKATNAKTKVRDAFGVEPGSGGKAQQEGGLLVCLPEAGGTFYSGRDRNRWIKKDGTRLDENLPDHVFGSFFPRQGLVNHNIRTVQQPGQMFVLAWDFAFDDNAGFYKVFVKLTKGKGPPPNPNPTLRKGSTDKSK